MRLLERHWIHGDGDNLSLLPVSPSPSTNALCMSWIRGQCMTCHAARRTRTRIGFSRQMVDC